MDESTYYIGYKFDEVEIFPVQVSTTTGTYVVKKDTINAMIAAKLYRTPDAMIIHRPDQSTNFRSVSEQEAFEESGLKDLIIRNNKGESTIFTAKSHETIKQLNHESTEA